MTTPRLYDDLADLWPLLSPPEDYAPEAAVVRRIIDGHVQRDESTRPTLLELGAGGGHTLVHLREAFECVAVDLSEPMLANCRRLNPDVRTIVGDMRSIRLERTFDAVLIHDAIDYLLTEADVGATLSTVAAHLNPGGVALIAPTYTGESFDDHQMEQDQRADPHTGRVLTYFQYVHDPDPSDTAFELILVYLINDAGTVRIEHDRHVCGLFDTATWLRLMREAGLDAHEHAAGPDEPDWPLFVGVRRD